MKMITQVCSKKERPVKVVQFGEGNFLRAFVDWQIDIMNEKAGFNGNVVIIQPLERGMADYINKQDCLYTTMLRGMENKKPVTRFRKIDSIERCINPYSEYDQFLETAEIESLRFLISNTTEAGIAFDEKDRKEDTPPSSYPAKVTLFLHHRFTHFHKDPSKGLIIIPCELIDKNGENLKRCILRYIELWNLGSEFLEWVNESCDFCNSLVDRIVPGYPKDEIENIQKELGYEDSILVSAELFHLWVIESGKSHSDELPTKEAGLNVIWTDDLSFYRTRKVRILNGAHTLTVPAAYLSGLNTVEECTKDPEFSRFMRQGIFEEIIPGMDGDVAELKSYAEDVLERFKNPFIKHFLLSISLNSVSKFATRDLPSLLAYHEKKHTLPPALTLSLAALIKFYTITGEKDGCCFGSRDGESYPIKDTEEILASFKAMAKESNSSLAQKVLSNTGWWHRDLTEIENLKETVTRHMDTIDEKGMREAVKEVLHG